MKRRSFLTILSALPFKAWGKTKPVEEKFKILAGVRGSAKTNAAFDHVWKGDFNECRKMHDAMKLYRAGDSTTEYVSLKGECIITNNTIEFSSGDLHKFPFARISK